LQSVVTSGGASKLIGKRLCSRCVAAALTGLRKSGLNPYIRKSQTGSVWRRSLLVTALFVLSTSWSGAAKEIELRVPTHDCSAPCDITVTAVIPRDPDNRVASVVWSYDGSADLPLGPDTAQVEFAVPIGKLDKGKHTVYAVLMRDVGGRRETFQDAQDISVH
jgi:hypothetical protein